MISVNCLHKSYGGTSVLRGVDLAVGRGETVVIIGPSGAGKTTLLRCLNFLSEYDSGQIHVDGKLMWFKDAACSARRPIREIAADRAEVRHVRSAAVHHVRAPRMERAAGRQVDQAGRLAVDGL